MLSALSFRGKIIVLIAIGFLMASVLTGVSYIGIAKLVKSGQEQTQAASILRSGMLVDMMHDAVHSDVLSALLLTAKLDFNQGAKESVLALLEKHVQLFREELEKINNSGLDTTEIKAYTSTKKDAEDYLIKAKEIIVLAFQDHAAAEQNLPEFTQQFEKLEFSLDALGDLLENKGQQIERQATAVGHSAYFTLLLVAGLGLVMLIGMSIIIALKLFRELGGDPMAIQQIAEKISAGNVNVNVPVKLGDSYSVMAAMAHIKGTLTSLVSEMEGLTVAHMRGEIDAAIDTSKFSGEFLKIALNTNDMVQGYVALTKQNIACIEAFGAGDFDVDLCEFPGKLAFINTTIEQVRSNLKAIVEDTYRLAAATQEGNLSVRADADRHKGDYRKIILGINSAMDAIVTPLQEAIGQVKKISRGDLSGQLTAEYKGEFGELKKRLGYLTISIQGLIDSIMFVSEQHAKGNIDIMVAHENFSGAFGEVGRAINTLVQDHINTKMQAVKIMQHYSKGDFSVDMERLPGQRGVITAALDGVKSNLLKLQSEISGLVNAAVAGNLTARANLSDFEYDFKEMAESLNAMLDAVVTPLNTAADYVDRIANGDIPPKITEPYNGDFNTLKNNINTCIDAINALIDDTQLLSEAALDGRIQTRAETVRHHGDFRKIVTGINATLETIVAPIITVKSAVDSINTAAKEISAGNADLSHRTEQQAASLEQTASSMEQFASTVKQNADSARQANQMALTASDIAAKGGVIVQEVVDTMTSINESSRKIVDIISVIDSIALQTNILALNAAVEAARAGEQGRGFAVVASEVRNLAQRSAAAAKEIKELIGDSVEKVENGSKLVVEAGNTMVEIVDSVKQVTVIMADIAAASAEQSCGIDQVNQAVNQMDEVTQQNAALVEQAAAAAESLEEQAETMAKTVAHFRIDSEIRSSSTPLRATLSVVLPKPVVNQKMLKKQNEKDWN